LKDLLIATKNSKKCKEVLKILEGLSFNFKSLIDLSSIETVEENGLTFKENAEKKAITYSKLLGILTIADDSGLMVEKLDGKPGVYSSRFAGDDASDLDNNKKLLSMMQDIPEGQRQASFVCHIAIADSGRLILGCQARCDGDITFTSKGESGFGYDPVFIPKGYDKTFAELGQNIKNKLSHRYKALERAKEELKNIINGV